MWRNIWRITGVLMIGVIITGIVLLLNFTAPNPTGRRYSSEVVDLNLDNGAKGLEGERILALDLRAPLNTIEKHCICGEASTVASQCNLCRVNVPTVNTYRLPDFFTETYIADAKNRYTWLSSHSQDVAQMTDYADAAIALDIPLWVYVRVDTTVDQTMQDLVRSTGGDIVHYFATPDWVDPVNIIAIIGILIGGVIVVFVLWREFRETHHMSQIYRDVPDDQPESPTNRSFPTAPKQDDKDDGKVIIEVTSQKMDDAEEFMDKVKSRVDRMNGNGHVDINVDVIDDDEE
ncbi:MAG: hypothetical protein CL607_03110 [Anaerolineaceae bacterium]|nr:hypothetical protein [Anaerolineaceae bacterium]